MEKELISSILQGKSLLEHSTKGNWIKANGLLQMEVVTKVHSIMISHRVLVLGHSQTVTKLKENTLRLKKLDSKMMMII